METTLAGLYVPLITPFTADGELATDALEGLAHDVIDAGAAGLVALGTTGEPATLDAGERCTVLDVCARVCREGARGGGRGGGRGGSATLIVGTGSNDTRGSIDGLAELAKWPEVSAALTVVPYFSRPSQDGVVAHFGRLGAESPVPLIIYNVPYRTGRALELETLIRLAALPGVAGFKHAVGAIDEDTIGLMASHTTVLAGDDVFASPLLALGAAGGILASAHLRTDRFAELIRAWHAGEADHARALGHRLAALSRTLFAEPNPAVIKAVLHAQHRIPSAAVRLPLLPAGPATTEAALALLDQT